MGDLPPVFILAGGLGTRLQSMVSDRPKVLAEVGCVPFLDLQLKSLTRQGIREVVLLTGYMSEQIASFIGNEHFTIVNRHIKGRRIVWVA